MRETRDISEQPMLQTGYSLVNDIGNLTFVSDMCVLKSCVTSDNTISTTLNLNSFLAIYVMDCFQHIVEYSVTINQLIIRLIYFRCLDLTLSIQLF